MKISDLTQYFDNLVVAYFFGPPCRDTITVIVPGATILVPEAEVGKASGVKQTVQPINRPIFILQSF